MVKPEDVRAPEVEEFAALVRRLNNVVGRLDTIAEIEMLEALDELLPLIYSAAHRLPDVWDLPEGWGDDDATRAVEIDREQLRRKFGAKLGWHRFLRWVYDPFPAAGNQFHNVVEGDLALLLGDVCFHLADALDLYESGEQKKMEQALWDWRFGLVSGSGWAQYVMNAMLPIHFLAYRYYDIDSARFMI